MAQELRIALLGAFQLTAGATVITTVNTSRLQALLAYLVLHRGVPQSRQQLAFMFWPDSPDTQARTNFRTLLHRLRTALPDADVLLSVDAQSVAWRGDANDTLDVREFEQALAIAHAANADGADAEYAALEHAVALYQGDLLPTCYDEWIAPERERLQQQAIAALERLVDLLEHRRDYSAALAYARRLLRLDPLRETTHLHLMHVHAASGDRAAALRAFHAYATALRDELAAEPGLPSRVAYEQILAADPAPRPAAVLAMRGPLVGRTAEWARAQAAWQAAASGRPRLLVLAGEAGIGKTRLAEELLVWADRQGSVTAIARCYAAEGDLAYAPVTEWLRTDALWRRCTQLDAMWLSEVARLLPEVHTARPDVPAPQPLTERWQRQHLFEALARVMLAGDRTLLLVLDDLQWCDRDTLEWLHFLLRPSRAARLLLVATVRTEEADGRPTALLHDLRRTDQLTEIVLGRFNRAETAALAQHLTGRSLSTAAVAMMYAETEGNPLFVVESVRAGLVREVPRMAVTDATTTLGDVPPGIHAVISHRLNQLTPEARELLRVAAVIGRSFTFGVLARASAVAEDTLVRSLDELWQRRIVCEHGADAYDFSHDKLRVVVYAELSMARRRMLHQRVADALVAEHAAHVDAASAHIAAQYASAGGVVPAVAFYRRAADVAQQRGANAEAIGYLRRALALLAAASAGDPAGTQPIAAALNERLGELLHAAGQYPAARAAFERARELTPTTDQLTCAQLARKLGNAWREQQRYAEAMAAYTAGERALGLTPDDADRERWLTWLEIQFERILTAYWLAQVPELVLLITTARPIAERYGSPLQRARLDHVAGQAQLRRDRNVASAQTVAAALAYLQAVEAAGAAGALPAARFQVGLILLLHGDLDAAEAPLSAALEMAERTGDISLEARCVTYLAVLSRKRGQVEQVHTYAERGLRIAQAEAMPDYIGAAQANLAWLAWRAGQLHAAQAWGEQALATWRATALVFALQWLALWPLIGVALADNRVDKVGEYARHVCDQRQQRLPEALETALTAAVQAADAGDPAAVSAALAPVLDLARTLGCL